MQTLFNDSEVFTKARPTKPTEQQLDEFFIEKAKEVIKNGFSTDDEADIAEDLEGIIPFTDNGYELAKSLERYSSNASYNIDTSFCEWLDGLSSEYLSLNDKNVKDWVAAHNPKPKYENGAKLLVSKALAYQMGVGLTVYVTGFQTSQANYLIDVNPERKVGTVLAYERVEECCVPA